MPRAAGTWGLVPGLIVIALLVGALAVVLPRLGPDGQGYEALSQGLQVDVPALGPEQSWRDGPPADPSGPAWLQALMAAAALVGEGVFWLIRTVLTFLFGWVGATLLAALILSGVAYLIWKYGRVAGPGLGRAPGRSARPGVAAAPLPEASGPDLKAIRAMTDPSQALGALVSLALTAAARLCGVRLGRSDTARGALRRLPSDFEFMSALRALVVEAERVRFAGAAISRERVEALIEAVRGLIERAAALEGSPS